MAIVVIPEYKEKDVTFEYLGLNHFSLFTLIKNKEGK